SVFSALDGSLLHQIHLYAGGISNRHPRARLLQVDETESILMGSGSLSLLSLDGNIISQNVGQDCLPG
ncbi:MAG: hypothetical protein KC547_17485, partial [Anaerolineae bacterium]|nr:hypothetical protein [Anaerolineae bacterium]